MSNFKQVAQCAFEKKIAKHKASTKRDSKAYSTWRHHCLERDKYKCVLCDSGEQLNVHHILRWIDNPIYRLKKFNGATLCAVCHVKWHNGKGDTFPKEISAKLLERIKANGQKFRKL